MIAAGFPTALTELQYHFKKILAARLEDWPFSDGVRRNLTGMDGALRHPRRAAAAQRVSRDWHLKRDPFRPL